MKHEILSVRDSKAEIFGRPFFTNTLGTAIRSFDDEVNRHTEGNIMAEHPEDFSLWHLGSFEDNDGTFAPMVPKLILQGNEVVKSINHISKV
ncbi:MAG: nonstructural protein [Microvirus sp.]|nr:MAG: nonstructural protein [Microvirus sp.]